MKNEVANREYYDLVSNYYVEKHNIDLDDMDIFIDDVEYAYGARVKNLSILDCGCGTGRGAIKYAIMQNQVSAIDISALMVKKCMELCAELNLTVNAVIGDCTALPFDDEVFDIVSTSASLHHISNLQKAISEMRRVLKPNGRLILIAEPKEALIRPKWVIDMKERLSARFDEQRLGLHFLGDNPDIHIFNVNELVGIIERIGFADFKTRCFSTLSSLYRDCMYYRTHNPYSRKKAIERLSRIDRKLLKITPDYLKSRFNLSARKTL